MDEKHVCSGEYRASYRVYEIWEYNQYAKHWFLIDNCAECHNEWTLTQVFYHEKIFLNYIVMRFKYSLQVYNISATPKRTSRDHPYAAKAAQPTPRKPLGQAGIRKPCEPTSSSSSPGTISEVEGLEVSFFQPSGSAESSQESEGNERRPSDPAKENKFMVFQSCLEDLMKYCNQCGSPVVHTSSYTTGSMVTYELHCHQGHEVRWHSQPRIGRQPLGNIILAAATLFSGLTFSRLANWARNVSLYFISETSFLTIQNFSLWPVVQEAWNKERKKACEEAKADTTAITVGGDCRCDSPGHNAHYGSYSIMNISPDRPMKILSMELVDFSEVSEGAKGHLVVKSLLRRYYS